MSRVGKVPVNVPSGVEIAVDGNNVVTVKGPKGTLTQKISDKLTIDKEEGILKVSVNENSNAANSQHGLARTLINNMILGVTDGFSKKLLITGVGYRAEKRGDTLVMQLGYSHPVELKDPEGITTEVFSPTASQVEITVRGIDKVLVGNYAANIRAWRAPEPYKGKGIRYENEYIRRKVGKTGSSGASK